jgi:hypothetical protein
MKQRLFPFVLSFTLAISSFCLAGCNTVSTRLVPYVGVPKFPPSDPNTIEILQAEPKQAHDRLGEVVASPSDGVSAQQIEAALRRDAAKLGADAAVLVHDKFHTVGTVVWGPYWAPSISPVSERVIVVVAIKYK